MTGALGAHQRKRSLCEPQGAEKVDVKDGPRILLADLLGDADEAVARVVHQDVEAARVLVSFLDGSPAVIPVGWVEPHHGQRRVLHR